jgi:hypothetical protein
MVVVVVVVVVSGFSTTHFFLSLSPSENVNKRLTRQ